MVNGPKVVKALGMAWIYLACFVMLIGYGAVVYQNGFMALVEMLSPYNIANYIVVVLTLAPGIWAVTWANKKLGQ